MIKPIGDRVLVKQHTEDTTTDSGIHIGGEEELTLPRGVVIDVGVRADLEEVKQGDTVYFPDFAGQEIEYKGTTYKILKITEILAKC